ncbi:MAG: GxxExxY protein [Armatimonadia bacterium]
MADQYQDMELTGAIIGTCFEVHNELGRGYLESVYEQALIVALQDRGLIAERQVPLQVRFRGHVVGNFYADIVVAGKVIVELKAVSALTQEHSAQLITYLKGSGVDIGLLVNFGAPKLEHRRCWRPAFDPDPNSPYPSHP